MLVNNTADASCICCLPADQSHLTNHAQNQSAEVWPLQRLSDIVGPRKSVELWAQLSSTAGRVVAAAGSHVKAAAQELQLPKECAFELLGGFSVKVADYMQQ